MDSLVTLLYAVGPFLYVFDLGKPVYWVLTSTHETQLVLSGVSPGTSLSLGYSPPPEPSRAPYGPQERV